jgi:hypothetical protein
MNMLKHENIGMMQFNTPGPHSFNILVNHSGNPGKVSYMIDSAITHTSISVTLGAWNQVKFSAVSTGIDAYWNGTLLFHSDLDTQISQILFGSQWPTAACAYDDFSFLPLTVVQGNITLQNYAGNLRDVTVKIQLRKSGTVERTEYVQLESDGYFSIPKNGATGTYDILIKSYSHLQKVLTVDLTSNPVNLGNIILNAGDLNGDNSVNMSDVNLMAPRWGDSEAQ